MIEKAGGRLVRSGRVSEKALSFSLPDPARRPPAFLIVPTDGEPGTGHTVHSSYQSHHREYVAYVILFCMMCRISFIYGLLWEHENLTPLTHDTLHEFFGYVTAKVSKQLALTMREKKLVSASGEDIYLPDVDKKNRLESSAYRERINRLNMPISFIVGKRP